MAYEVWLSSSVERDLKRLEAQYFNRIIKPIKSLAKDPKPSGCRKITGTKNDYRIRVGEFRIIYEIDDKEKAVRVMRVRHRKEAYRKD